MMLRVRHDRGAELCLPHEGPGPWGSGGWWVELGEERNALWGGNGMKHAMLC